MIDNIIYKLESIDEDLEEAIDKDYPYFLERRGELVDIFEQFIKRIEND